MQCPIDQTPLKSQTYEAGIRVDTCPTCCGLWLEQGELEAIEETLERDYSEELARMPDLGYSAYLLAEQKSGRVLRCPRCAVEMEQREYARCSQVMIDVCPNCHGVWLDQGELEALEVFYERSRFEAGAMRRAFITGLRGFRPPSRQRGR